MTKRETIEEFLARGGAITVVPPAPEPEETYTNKVTPMSGASSTMMTLGEGALYYSESRAKPKERKKKLEKTINLDALPSRLLKFVPKH